MTTHRSILRGVFAMLLCLAWAPAAFADDATLEKALSEGTDNYDMAMLEESEQALNDGIAHAESEGLNGPMVAKLYLMRGIVRFAQNQNKKQAEKDFIKAVEADPGVQIDPVYETPALTKVMTSARKKAKPPKNPVKNPPDRPIKNPPASGDFTHDVVTRADAGKPFPFKANVPESLGAKRVVVFHKRFGESSYTELEMLQIQGPLYAANLPKGQVRTSTLDYYIAVYNDNDEIVANSGSADKPNTMLVRGSGDIQDPDPDPDPDPQPTPAVASKVFYFMLAGGSGFGFLPGGVPTANVDREVSPGLAPAFGHGLLDLGWVINNDMRLGLFLRYQFSPYQDFSQLTSVESGNFATTEQECFGLGLPGDCVLGLKYRYFLTGQSERDLRVYSTVGAGIGRVRNWVQIKERESSSACAGKEIFSSPNSENFCYLRDTVRTGFAHFGLGAGLAVPIADVVSFVADTYLMVLTPAQTSVNLDVNLGFMFQF